MRFGRAQDNMCLTRHPLWTSRPTRASTIQGGTVMSDHNGAMSISRRRLIVGGSVTAATLALPLNAATPPRSSSMTVIDTLTAQNEEFSRTRYSSTLKIVPLAATSHHRVCRPPRRSGGDFRAETGRGGGDSQRRRPGVSLNTSNHGHARGGRESEWRYPGQGVEPGGSASQPIAASTLSYIHQKCWQNTSVSRHLTCRQ